MLTDKQTKQIKEFSKNIEDNIAPNLVVIPDLGIVVPDIETISTGSKAVDDILGIGGLPRGRVVEIMGSEGSGKTTLALTTIAQAQKKGLMCAYIDTEQALEQKRALDLGVDFGALTIAQPSNAEEALDLLEAECVSGLFGVIVLDSVAALVPKAELEGTMEDATIGVQARLMGKILRKITPAVNKEKVLVIFINQVRQKIGGFMPFPMEVTSGGNALKFYASVRIDCRKTGMTKAKISLAEIKVTVKKNKLAIPMQQAKLRLGKEGWLE